MSITQIQLLINNNKKCTEIFHLWLIPSFFTWRCNKVLLYCVFGQLEQLLGTFTLRYSISSQIQVSVHNMKFKGKV